MHGCMTTVYGTELYIARVSQLLASKIYIMYTEVGPRYNVPIYV